MFEGYTDRKSMQISFDPKEEYNLETREDMEKQFNILIQYARDNFKEIETKEDLFYDGYEDDMLVMRSIIHLDAMLQISYQGINDRWKYEPVSGGSILSTSLLLLLVGDRMYLKMSPEETEVYDEIEKDLFNSALKYYTGCPERAGTMKDILEIFDRLESAYKWCKETREKRKLERGN